MTSESQTATPLSGGQEAYVPKVGDVVVVTSAEGEGEGDVSCGFNEAFVGKKGTVTGLKKDYVLKVKFEHSDSIWSIKTYDVSFAKPKSYTERQAEWVKKHNIKVGSKVKVVRAFKNQEDGFSSIYGEAYRDLDKILTVKAFQSRTGSPVIKLSSNRFHPYFVLEPVE